MAHTPRRSSRSPSFHVVIGSLALLSTVDLSAREIVPFDDAWRFHKGAAPDEGESLDYQKIKPWVLATGVELIADGIARPERPPGNPGEGVSFVYPDFDDRGWRLLDLPHDWAIEGPFSQDLPGETGKLPWQGTGWYRKRFEIPAADAGKSVFLEIDGAMSYSAVWLNGAFVGGWPYGYSSFRLDLTPHLRIGGENVLSIRLHNLENSSRWYPGAGLYRHVRLVKTSPVRVAQWGTFVTTPIVSAEEAVVKVAVRVENASGAKTRVALETAIHELGADGRPAGEPVAVSGRLEYDIDPARASEAHRTQLLRVPYPKLWDTESPHRYVAVTRVAADGKPADVYETPFGIRTIRFDPAKGFFLNGRKVMINGVCMHHDLGALGAAVNLRALERQIEILQEMGANSIRTSHNPPTPELLELCDRMGVLLQVEAFDAWRKGKKPIPGTTEADGPMHYSDYGRLYDDWHERDLRAMIRRDRNHPSVVMWSIGNEILELHFDDGWKTAARLSGIVREEDRTRPITVGSNSTTAPFHGFQSAVDIVGFNYKFAQYPKFHDEHPDIPVHGAETASTISSRGEYFFPVSDDKAHGRSDFQMSSYDLYAPPWAWAPDTEWKAMDEAPYVFGEYVWTGFDYLGEPTPYNSDSTNLLNFADPVERARMERELAELGKIRVPSRSSYFGIVDLAGFPKDRYYIYQARWRPDLPMAHILPHWNWPERVGQVTPVHVYSSGDEAELFLNGRSLGRRSRGPFVYRFRWDDVVYEPGELKVVTWKNGRPWAETVMRTTGAASKLLLAADRAAIAADGRDLAYLTATVADAAGLLVPRSKPLLRFTVEGPGEIVATDNGDATSHIEFQSPERPAFNGLALAIVRLQRGATEPVRVRVESEGLEPAVVELRPVR
jgi:beta-galactosidase